MKKTLPLKFETKKDLDDALNYFYSEEVQSTDKKHLRFGQFIFNTYNIEYKNSYNIQDPFLAFKLLDTYILNLK